MSSRSTISSLSLPIATLAERSRIIRCRNLRPSPSGGLQATGSPTVIAAIPGAQPVSGGLFTLSDSSVCIIIYHEGHLKAVIGTEITDIAPIGDIPRCIIPLDSGNAIVVMPSSGKPMRYALTTASFPDNAAHTWVESPLFPSLPPLMLTRRDMGTVSASVPSVTLHGSYSTSSHELSDTDRATLDKVMRQAYTRLADSACLHGRYIQPVVARYRLIGDGGVSLYTSAPVIVTPAYGLQATQATVHLSGDGFATTSGSRLTATEFTIEAVNTREPDETWRTLVRSVEILISPQLHPMSPTLPGTFTLSGSSSTGLTFTHTLPGVNTFDGGSSFAVSYVTAILDNADILLRPGGYATDCDREIDALRSILSMPTEPSYENSAMTARLSPPHTFTAGTASCNGDLIAWGDLKAIPFDGYTLPETAISADSSADSTPTAVLTTMHDGSSVVRSSVMHSLTPTALSPLILYPDPDAASVTLLAGRQAVTLPLTPTPGRRWAYYLSPSLSPLSFNEEREAFVLPAAAPASRRYQSGIAVTAASSPLKPLAATSGDISHILRIIPAVRHSNSFTVPSARFYIIGTAGMSSMALNDKRTRINLNLLDGRSVASPLSATPIPSGIAVLFGRRLVSVSGSKTATLIEDCGEASALGYCHSTGELWCISPQVTVSDSSPDPITILSLDNSYRYTRRDLNISSVVSSAASMILIDNMGRILDPAVETGTDTTVRYTATIPHGLCPGNAASLRIPLLGRQVSGDITVTASHSKPSRTMPTASAMLRRLSISGGDLNHHIVENILIPHSHHLTVDIACSGKELKIENS